MTKVETIHATYEIITPLFCGGADPETAELRLPSFKGVLRWYWRAVVWQQLGGELEKIRHEENVIFGSSATGQGKVCMRLRGTAVPPARLPEKEKQILKDPNGQVVGPGARYLGYGVLHAFDNKDGTKKAGQLTRGCLLPPPLPRPPLTLSIELRCRGLHAHERARLLLALRAIGLLGAMGSKSRKGYGSLVLRKLSIDDQPPWPAPTTIDELRTAIAELYQCEDRSKSRTPAEPPYTALSQQSRHILVPAPQELDAISLLNRVGREIVRYRSWGKHGKVLGNVPREENFADDHNMFRSSKKATTHPYRAVFGLPHNYGGQSQDEVKPARASRLDRRASPLLIHIHQCGSIYVAVLSFLPAAFLPDGVRIDAFGTEVQVEKSPALWAPIEDLLDRFLGKTKPDSRAGERCEPFGTALEVRP